MSFVFGADYGGSHDNVSVLLRLFKGLLTQTNAPISEISLTAGCYDTSHLVRIFKKQTDKTPSEYRKNKG